MRVLVVEDDPDLNRQLVAALTVPANLGTPGPDMFYYLILRRTPVTRIEDMLRQAKRRSEKFLKMWQRSAGERAD